MPQAASAASLEEIEKLLRYRQGAYVADCVSTSDCTEEAKSLVNAINDRNWWVPGITSCKGSNTFAEVQACRLIRLGDNLALGHFSEVAHESDQLPASLQTVIDQYLPPNIAALAKAVGNSSEEKVAGHIALSDVEDGVLLADTWPKIPVIINGQNSKVLLDTGSSVTIISTGDAQRLGVKLLGGMGHARSYYGKGNEPVQWGILNELEIAGSRFNDVLVRVGGQMSMLGLDMMLRVNSLLIDHDRVEFNLSSAALTDRFDHCVAPVKWSSDFLRSNQSIYVEAIIAGKPRQVGIDTGSMFELFTPIPLFGSDHPSATKPLWDVSGLRTVNQRTYQTDVTLRQRKYPMELSVLKDATPLAPFVLGWPAFNKLSLLLDNQAKKGCLLDAPN
jgi:hypothetical protein